MKDIPRVDGLQESTASSNRPEQPSSRLARGFLALAVMLIMVHYAFGEWVFHPGLKIWKYSVFWQDLLRYATLPVVFWCGWKVVSLGKLRISRLLFLTTILLCVGDAFFYMMPSILKSIERLHLHEFKTPVEKWDWVSYWYMWTFWLPAVLIVGNLVLLKRWWGLFGPTLFSWKSNAAKKKTTWSKLILESVAVVTATAAIGLTAIHLGLPRMSINDTTVSLAETFLVQSQYEGDFEHLISDPVYQGKRLGAILVHAELADLQRKQFYPNLDASIFQQYVLSPDVDGLPLNEIDWRRTLWENFYPRIRHEDDPVAAAQIVVRFLRERVGIDPSYRYRVGVETIWTQQMTDIAGFERIYVAALRSVGIAARLNDQNKTELWTGKEWQIAPKPLISTLRACLKIRKGAVFEGKLLWQGATRENIRYGSSTEEQRGQSGFPSKTLRAAALLKPDFVVAGLTAGCGDAQPSPPRPAPKSLAAAPFPIFRQALNLTG